MQSLPALFLFKLKIPIPGVEHAVNRSDAQKTYHRGEVHQADLGLGETGGHEDWRGKTTRSRQEMKKPSRFNM